MSIETVGMVADEHSGSLCGLYPESLWNNKTPDAIKWLWEKRNDLVEHWPKLDLLICVGDQIDGKQAKSVGVGVYTTEMKGQTEIAIECAAPLVAKAKKVVRVSGTSYHEGFDGALALFDERLGVAKPPTMAKELVRDIELDGGTILNVKHKPEGESCLYHGTSQDRELLWATVAETCKNLPDATFVARAHLHNKGFHYGFGKYFIGMPCWCLQPPYAIQKRYYRWMPDIGGVLLNRDDNADGGYHVSIKTYDIPGVEADTYDSL